MGSRLRSSFSHTSGRRVISTFLATQVRLLIVAVLILLPISVQALTASNGDFEGEAFTSGLNRQTFVRKDSAASGGKTLVILTNRTVSKTVTTPSVTSLTVTARATLCSGAPKMTVKVDGAVALNNMSVSSTKYGKYTGTVNLSAKSHKIDLSFTNDTYKGKGCDRNLYIDKIEFKPGTPPNPTPNPNPNPNPNPGGDTQAPSVLIVTPKSNDVISGKSTAIQANASDNVGVTKVEFYLDNATAPTATQTGAPYCLAGDSGSGCFGWDSTTVSDGSHKLVAKAYDAAGHSTDSTPVTFVVQNTTPTPPPTTDPTPPPVIGKVQVITDTNASAGKALGFYANGSSTKDTTTPDVSAITVTARGDQCGGAPQMTVKVDGNTVLNNVNVTSTTYRPYTATLSNVNAGKHTVDIIYGNYQLNGCSRNLIVDKVEFTPVVHSNDTTPPTVSVTSPQDGGTVSGKIAVQATATDTGSGIKQVDFTVDGATTALVSRTSAPYCLTTQTSSGCAADWDTSKLADGAHTITVTAVDNANNSKQVTSHFTIQNGIVTPPPSGGAPTALFDGMSNPNLSTSNLTPFASFSHSKNGTFRLADVAGTNHKWIQLETNDNRVVSDYYVNTFDNPDTLTVRSQLELPVTGKSGKVLMGINTDRWLTYQFRTDAPPVAPAHTPSPYGNGVSYFTSGELYGPPYAGSSPFSMRLNNSADGNFTLNLHGSMFQVTVKRNTTYTLLLHFKGPSSASASDAFTEIYWSEGNTPAVQQTLKDANGNPAKRVYWQVINSSDNGGALNWRINNYHRAFMDGWDGKHSNWFYGPFIYDAANVSSPSQIDPYYLLGGR